jgi:N-acetyl-beta-hexosaminidase
LLSLLSLASNRDYFNGLATSEAARTQEKEPGLPTFFQVPYRVGPHACIGFLCLPLNGALAGASHRPNVTHQLQQEVSIVTCATSNLSFQHPGKTLATYIRKQLKHLQHRSKTLAKHMEKQLKVIAKICNIQMKTLVKTDI